MSIAEAFALIRRIAESEEQKSTSPKSRAMRRRSFIAELFDFIMSNKAYFIAPVILVLLLVGALIILGGTKAAPFIYTLF